MTSDVGSAAPEIHSPYPGLRPFHPSEAAMFYGRDSQIGEVLQRLRASHFVALLGGSGSGKSSLIRAGVIPHLRSYQLREAGDFWLPIVFTPGTNSAGAGSPLDRLALAFAEILRRPGPDAGAEATRRESERQARHVELLRDENGLANLVEAATPDLLVEPVLDPKAANFLIVIDQFEELFHPSNASVEDCSRLVELVLGHFRRFHPRVYVVMTMRSEHLNDCARYLYLPDAINKASYLIRRLEPDEIGEAIERPVKRFLRLRTRDPRGRGKLPTTVELESAVVDHLKADAEALASDPDHLPLLQHALFRVWEVACARARSQGMEIPERITEDDLAAAVSAGLPPSGADERPGSRSLLRSCLDHWGERLYGDRPHEDRALAEQVFRRLGFCDPNTGVYTQQRIDLTALARTLAVPETKVAEIVHAYVAPHEYLSADAGTGLVKVAHESFIRGWGRFRRWIDEEDERFREFMNVLREGEHWASGGRLSADLLGAGRLRRIREAGLDSVLRGEPAEALQRLFALIRIRRDSERWSLDADTVKEFYGTSAEYERKRRRHRTWRRSGITLGGVVLLTLLGIYLLEVSYQRREARWFQSFGIASVTAKRFRPEFRALEDAKVPLHHALVAARHFTDPQGGWEQLHQVIPNWLPGLGARSDRLERSGVLAESQVAATLQGVLTSAPWVPPDRAGPHVAPRLESATCAWPGDPARRETVTLVKPTPGHAPWRALILRSGSLELYAAKLAGPVCTFGAQVLSLPPSSILGIDGHLHYLLAAVPDQQHPNRRILLVYGLIWYDDEDGTLLQAQAVPVATLSDGGPALAASDTRPGTVVPLPSAHVDGGLDITLAGGVLRFFDSRVGRLAKDPRSAPDVWMPLVPDPDEHGPCQPVRKWLQDQPTTARGSDLLRVDYLAAPASSRADHTECVVVREVAPRSADPSSPAIKPPRTEKIASVYRAGRTNPVGPPVVLMEDIRFGTVPGKVFYLGTGRYRGWIATDDAEARRMASPWSVQAWHRLGCEVLGTKWPPGLIRDNQDYDLLVKNAFSGDLRRIDEKPCP